MAFSFSSTGGSSGVTSITVSATSRQELTDIVENFTLANQTKSLGLQVGQRAYEPLEKYIIFQPTGMTWAASGDTGSLNIQSNDDWTIVSDGWIQLSRYEEANRGQVERPNTLSGNGNTIVGLRCSENTGETRTGGITGYCKSNSAISATTVIEQAGSYVKPYLTLSSTGCSIGSSSASTSVTVTSNISWDVISDVRWITINTLSGTGNGTISLEVSGNADSIPRKGVVTVFNATYDIYAEFVVEQTGEKQYIVISPYSFQVPSTGSSGNVISISANCDYDITTDVNWITLSAASGSGNGSVSFTTGENTSKYGETGNIIFSNSAVASYATVEIMSVENYLSANTSSLNASIDGDTLSVNVYSNVAWMVSVDQNTESEFEVQWISVAPVSGNGNDTLKITVASGTTARSGIIMLYNSKYGLSWSIEIRQKYGNNAILYTTSDGNIAEPNNLTGWSANVVSNTYVDGQGILVFDNNITTIPPNGFNGKKLTSIELPETVHTIDNFGFYSNNFTDFIIPDTVTEVHRGAFQSCSALTAMTIGKNCTVFGEEAYRPINNAVLKKLVIRTENIPTKFIGGDSNVRTVLSGCEVTFDTTVKTIGASAFTWQQIENIVFNTTTITSIGDRAFHYNKLSGPLSLPNSITSIGIYSFGNCTGITSIDNLGSVTEIPDYCFVGTSGITNLVIPEGVTRIGQLAFTQGSYTALTIPRTITYIDNRAFDANRSLTVIYSYTDTVPMGITSAFTSQSYMNVTVHYPAGSDYSSWENNSNYRTWTFIGDL